MTATNNLEIEHKYLVDPRLWPKDEFESKLQSFGASRIYTISVEDTYFGFKNLKHHIFRHRFDAEIQQITVKSAGVANDVRLEINLDLDQKKGSQLTKIQDFFGVFGEFWQGKISKQVLVGYFPDCEIVRYDAKMTDDRNSDKQVTCIEFEATNYKTESEAFEIIERYANKFGLKSKEREKQSLFELLLYESSPEYIRQIFSQSKLKEE